MLWIKNFDKLEISEIKNRDKHLKAITYLLLDLDH